MELQISLYVNQLKVKTIKIKNYPGYDDDLTVKLSSSNLYNDHLSIYNDSNLTIEEAIAVLIAPSLLILDKVNLESKI